MAKKPFVLWRRGTRDRSPAKAVSWSNIRRPEAERNRFRFRGRLLRPEFTLPRNAKAFRSGLELQLHIRRFLVRFMCYRVLASVNAGCYNAVERSLKRSLMNTAQPGDKRVGCYQIVSTLGHGGMATVYQARALEDRPALGLKRGDDVAIKVLHPHLAAIKEFNRRFIREAKVAAKFVHPNVARVIDFDTDSDGHPYLVLELVRGEKLRDVLNREGALPPSRVLGILRQVAAVFETARQIGLIHRDIKPDNLMLNEAGQVKVLDFGLVKDEETVSMVSEVISMTGKIMGTPAYMSPEQCQGAKTVDHRSDLYSIGVTAYHMAAGKMPFEGPTPSAFLQQHQTAIPPRIEKLNPAVPKPLIAIIYRLMAKNPDDRYQTAGELLADLEKAEEGEMPTKTYRFRKQRHLSAQRAVALAAAAVVLALAGAAALYYTSTDAARTEMQQVQTMARQAAEAGDPSRAVNLLTAAISKHARRRELLPPLEKLRDELSSLAAAQEKAQQEKRTAEEREQKAKLETERKQQAQQLQDACDKLFQQGVAALKDKRYPDALQAFQLAQAKRPTEEVKQQIAEVRARQGREQAAAAALAEARAAFARNDLPKAKQLAEQGGRDYSDTDAAKAFADLRVEAEGKLAAAAEQAQAAMKQAQERLVQQALTALKDRRYPDALQAFEMAQSKLADPQIKAQIETLKARIELEKGAVALLAEARAAFARNDLPQAAALAAKGVKEFGGSDEANDFAILRVEAEQKQAATMAQKQARARQLEQQGDDAKKAGELRDALTAWQSAAALVASAALDQKIAAAGDALKRYDTAVAAGRQLLDAGRAGKDKAKCLEAARRFEEARRAWATADAAALISEAEQTAAAIKEQIAVVDFQVQGDVGVSDAGKIVARLLLDEFAGKFELVTRTQLETVLKEKNLQFHDLMTPDKALQNAKLLPVRYLIVGEVMKGAEFWLTAQMVEVGLGVIRNPRKISARQLSRAGVADSDAGRAAQHERRGLSQVATERPAARAGRRHGPAGQGLDQQPRHEVRPRARHARAVLHLGDAGQGLRRLRQRQPRRGRLVAERDLRKRAGEQRP